MMQPLRAVHHDLRKERDRLKSGAITFASSSKRALDLGPGTERRSPTCLIAGARPSDGSSFTKSTPCCGDEPGTPPKALDEMVRDRKRRPFPIEREARPRVEIDDHRLAVRPDDRVSTEDLNTERRRRAEGSVAQASRVRTHGPTSLCRDGRTTGTSRRRPALRTAGRHRI